MNFLIHQNFQPKTSVFRRNFVSTIAVVENPSFFHDKHEHNVSLLNPFHFFNDWTKSRKWTINDTKVIHAHFLKTTNFNSYIYVANSLVDCYCKSNAMADALRLFEQIPKPDTVSWNLMISGYNQNILFEDTWRTFCRMRFLGFDPNQFTYGSVLSACKAMQSPLWGKQVYSLALKNGFFSNGYVRAGMIDLFSKYCSFEDALRVFYDVSCNNVVCWNAIISGAVNEKENWVALDLFSQMCHGYLMPNSFTFSSILTACAALEELELGRGVQGWVIKCGEEEDVFVGTAIIDLYAKCGNMGEAVKKFSRMPIRNVVSWTAIISGFVREDDYISALQFFKEFIKTRKDINNYTVTSVLTACANPVMFKEAIQIHCLIFKSGFYCDSAVKASLINMYSKIGAIDLSEMVFRESEDSKHLGTWAVMVSTLVQNENPERAINLFLRIFQEGLRPDKFCSSSVLSIVDCLNLGTQIHCYTIKAGLVFDVSVGCSLFTMYSKCGSLEDSYEVFDQITEKDVVSWASMIAGFAEHGCADRAIQLFREMLFVKTRPDEMTLTAVLTACSALHFLKTGKEIHGYALRGGVGSQILAGGALVNMYSKCGALDLARRVFDMMPLKDQVSFSSLISGYARSGCLEQALLLFFEMQTADLEIISFYLSSILGAVAQLNRFVIGNQLHAHSMKVGLDSEVSVGSSLVMMYSKCGSIDECHKAFEQIWKPDLISWTSMIASCAQHGKGVEALRIYELMKESGIKPDSVTFVGVLSACSHSGLVEEGYFHLNSMVKDHGIEPGYRHYACMVDLLGRSGRLKEAERFINSMPIKPDPLVWGTLLAACKVHGDIELGRLAAKKVIELKPCDSGAYVSLSNIYADVGQWEEVINIRSVMEGTGTKKEPGWSSSV
ncbi:pentatricopeptide repeat-containing protein At1g74600, chloroplastic [Cornus florida]|uniref:pentatricopeptide repeat-containing protein At1g74600, chloroplastic n=1 Tax=Cornus florida TaxID=4283 RepID=UPI00289A6E79|nr:pentatricopeptide repeat-containing protein At1g74600, chloroplastic [Cornus florida]XP_059642027.1 pentatricopeptide repeat-containing protein At1g74600, chloroplastic [Cornus florida]